VIDVKVKIDLGPTMKMLEAVSGPMAAKVLSLALSDSVKSAGVQTAKILRPALGLPSAEIKKAIRTERARANHLSAAMVVSGKPLPMIRYKVRDTKKAGVLLRIGTPTRYRRAWIGTLRYGRNVFERAGTGRGKVRALYGPSIAGYFGKRSDCLPAVQRTIDARLPVTVAQRLHDAMWKAAHGK
jgi:minor tail protein Z (GPZ)